jgi:hypothetical protein
LRLIGSLRSFALVAAAIVMIPLLAGCAPAPATQAPASTAQPAAAPAATQPAATPVPTAAEQPSATGLEGQWEGPLKVAGQTLDMVVRFSGGGSALKGTLDVPSQAAKNIPLSNVNISQDGSKVHYEAFSGARLATYDGELQADGSLSGVFEQAGFKGTLAMQRVAAQPTAVLPYHQEEVSYKNGAINMACTLSTPPAGAPFPAVILITGSGAQNRKVISFIENVAQIFKRRYGHTTSLSARCSPRTNDPNRPSRFTPSACNLGRLSATSARSRSLSCTD